MKKKFKKNDLEEWCHKAIDECPKCGKINCDCDKKEKDDK